MSAQDGGPAFPVLARDPWKQLHSEGDQGMSLRDWFAGQALACLTYDPHDHTNDSHNFAARRAASIAYAIADAMLAARTKP